MPTYLIPMQPFSQGSLSLYDPRAESGFFLRTIKVCRSRNNPHLSSILPFRNKTLFRKKPIVISRVLQKALVKLYYSAPRTFHPHPLLPLPCSAPQVLRQPQRCCYMPRRAAARPMKAASIPGGVGVTRRERQRQATMVPPMQPKLARKGRPKRRSPALPCPTALRLLRRPCLPGFTLARCFVKFRFARCLEAARHGTGAAGSEASRSQADPGPVLLWLRMRLHARVPSGPPRLEPQASGPALPLLRASHCVFLRDQVGVGAWSASA